jgi:hypothetical protein
MMVDNDNININVVTSLCLWLEDNILVYVQYFNRKHWPNPAIGPTEFTCSKFVISATEPHTMMIFVSYYWYSAHQALCTSCSQSQFLFRALRRTALAIPCHHTPSSFTRRHIAWSVNTKLYILCRSAMCPKCHIVKMRLCKPKGFLLTGALTALVHPTWAASKEDLTRWVNPLIVRAIRP